jgi:hypothetical protein
VPPQEPGQRRHWVDRHELASPLESKFDVLEMRSITPKFNRGVLRVVNSYRIHHTLRTVGLSGLTRRVKEYQKQLWLGWTIVVAARPTPLVGVGTSQVSSWSLGRSAWGDRAGTLSADHGIYGRALRGNCIDPRAHAGTNRPDDSSTATYG